MQPAGSATAYAPSHIGKVIAIPCDSPNGGLATPSVFGVGVLNVWKPVALTGTEVQAASVTEFRTGLELQVVSKPGQSIYIEWPQTEPMENVLAVIHIVERSAKGAWRAVFDTSDDDCWEMLVGGYRLHGMFVSELTN